MRPYAPNGLGGGSLSRFLPGRSGPTDADAGQTDVSIDLARRNDRTPHGRSSRRRRPRHRSTMLRLALQPLHRRHGSSAGRRSRFRFVPRTDQQSLTTLRLALQPLPPRQRQHDSTGSRSRPASRRSTLRSSGNSTLEPQFPADSGGSTHDAKLHVASHSLADSALSIPVHTVEPYLNSTSLSTPFPHRCRTLQNTCVLKHGLHSSVVSREISSQAH